MLTRLHHWWQDKRSSFWFLPAMMVLNAVLLAIALIAIEATVDLHVVERWPLLFGVGAAGARGLLTAVAGSMITVAGVVFSITLVALSLASSQYSSRVIRNFMRDSINQVVLGAFVGIFAYCLVVLRTIRGGDEKTFIPSLAVSVGLFLAFVGIAFLIYFIDHISKSIQASSIVARVAQETIEAVDQLYPQELGADGDEDEDELWASLDPQPWASIHAGKNGYIESVDVNALLNVARKYGTILRMERGIGEFVVEGMPLVSVANPEVLDDEMTALVSGVYIISHQRTVEYDVAFGIRQIVDIAMKALSPGVNDTTTAVMCVDYLTAILVRLATRRIVTTHHHEHGVLRVIARGPSFKSLLAEAFNQIRQNASGNVAIMSRQLGALQIIAGQTTDPGRRRAVHEKVQWIADLAERTIASPYDRERFERHLVRVRKELVFR